MVTDEKLYKIRHDIEEVYYNTNIKVNRLNLIVADLVIMIVFMIYANFSNITVTIDTFNLLTIILVTKTILFFLLSKYFGKGKLIDRFKLFEKYYLHYLVEEPLGKDIIKKYLELFKNKKGSKYRGTTMIFLIVNAIISLTMLLNITL